VFQEKQWLYGTDNKGNHTPQLSAQKPSIKLDRNPYSCAEGQAWLPRERTRKYGKNLRKYTFPLQILKVFSTTEIINNELFLSLLLPVEGANRSIRI
jgi:hypothetical protein